MTNPSQTPCSIHPPSLRAVACERCGSFECSRCLSDVMLCAGCEERVLGELPRLDVVRYFAAGNLATMAVAGAGLLATSTLSPLTLSPTSLLWALRTLLLVSLPVAMIGAWVFYFRWLWVAVRRVRALGALQDVSPSYAFWSHLVPIVSLVTPFDIMRRLLRKAGEHGTVRWVAVWQASWFASSVAVGLGLLGVKMQTFSAFNSAMQLVTLTTLAYLVLKVGKLERAPSPQRTDGVATGDFALR